MIKIDLAKAMTDGDDTDETRPAWERDPVRHIPSTEEESDA